MLIAICLLYCFLVIVEAALPETVFSKEFGPFDETDNETFVVIDPAYIRDGALLLTPDLMSSGKGSGATNKYLTPDDSASARILLKEPFKLWGDNGMNASFNSSFLINVYRNDGYGTGEGFAFVIAPDLNPPPNSDGQFLGLVNRDMLDSQANKFVAVEFDTFKQDYDPDDNHVGIDVNSIMSITNAYLTPHNINISASGSNSYNVWVDYDGLSNVINVYMIAIQADNNSAIPAKPGSPVLSAHLNLRDHVNQFSYLGFSASTKMGITLNSVLRWNLTIHDFSDPKTKPDDIWRKIVLWAGVPALVLLLVVVAMFGYLFHKHRALSSNINLVVALQCLPGMPREFKFRDLKKATNCFGEENKLGQGGFGVVYRGLLVKENLEIAVKSFSRESIKGQHDFLTELTVINRLRHKHLVKLLGWCHKNGKLLLVYEYMPNGSLDQHLFVGSGKERLEWDLRHKIISGVASALHYLHNEYDQRVVHRDLKASNIMLDSEFNARLGDFGLARVLDNGKTSYAEAEGVPGTMGYIAPECLHTGKATRQSDIYAFGAVLLEVVCGQRPGTRIAGFQFLVDWVWMLHRDGKLLEAVDQRLGDDYVEEEAKKLLLLGLACSHPNCSERPNSHEILQIISGTMPVPIVPPFKPAFVWAAGGATNIDSANADGVMDTDSVNTITITVSDLAR